MLQKAWWTICAKYLNFFSFFLQISCQSQFPDYDTGEDSGLADNFQPSVKVSCVGGTMKIRVDTKTPFKGIIHGPNRTEPGCSVLGKDGLKTYFNIDLTRISGSWVRFFNKYYFYKNPWIFYTLTYYIRTVNNVLLNSRHKIIGNFLHDAKSFVSTNIPGKNLYWNIASQIFTSKYTISLENN